MTSKKEPDFPPTKQIIKDVADDFYGVECDARRLEEKYSIVTRSLLVVLGDVVSIIQKYITRDEMVAHGLNPDITKDLMRLMDNIVLNTQTVNGCQVHIQSLYNLCSIGKEELETLAAREKKTGHGGKK